MEDTARWAEGKGLVALLKTLHPKYVHLVVPKQDGSRPWEPASLAIKDINLAYKRAATILHPDRHLDRDWFFRSEAEDVLKHLTKAHASASSWLAGVLEHVEKTDLGKRTMPPARPYTKGMDGRRTLPTDDTDLFDAPPVRRLPVDDDDDDDEASLQQDDDDDDDNNEAEDDEGVDAEAPRASQLSTATSMAAAPTGAAPQRTCTMAAAPPPGAFADGSSTVDCSSGSASSTYYAHAPESALRDRIWHLEVALRTEKRERLEMEESMSAAYNGLIRELLEELAASKVTAAPPAAAGAGAASTARSTVASASFAVAPVCSAPAAPAAAAATKSTSSERSTDTRARRMAKPPPSAAATGWEDNEPHVVVPRGLSSLTAEARGALPRDCSGRGWADDEKGGSTFLPAGRNRSLHHTLEMD
jgi:hypothetical protein